MNLDAWTFARGLIQLEREGHPEADNIAATAGFGLAADQMNTVVDASTRYGGTHG